MTSEVELASESALFDLTVCHSELMFVIFTGLRRLSLTDLKVSPFLFLVFESCLRSCCCRMVFDLVSSMEEELTQPSLLLHSAFFSLRNDTTVVLSSLMISSASNTCRNISKVFKQICFADFAYSQHPCLSLCVCRLSFA